MREIAVKPRASQIEFTLWMNVQANVTIFTIGKGFARCSRVMIITPVASCAHRIEFAALFFRQFYL